MNKVFLIGNITKDPELSQTNGGISYCRFSVAVSRKFVNKEGERETDFLNCTAWYKTAEFVSKYFKKGSKICVVGSLQTNNYETNDGQKRTSMDIAVEEVEFAGGKPNGDEPRETSTTQTQGKKKTVLEPVEEDDLPF